MLAEERKKRDREEKERQRREEERKESEIRQKRDEERRRELEKAEEERKKRELDRREEEERRRKEWERQEQERKRVQEEEKRREVEWLAKKKREWERQEEERRKKEAEQQEEEKKKMEELRKERELKRKEEEERRRKEQQKEKDSHSLKGSPPPPPLSDPRPPGPRSSPPYPWRWAERSRPPPLTPQTEHAREKQRQREMAANHGGAPGGLPERERDRRPPSAVAALGELPKLYRAFPRDAPAPPSAPSSGRSGPTEGRGPGGDDDGAQFEEEPSELSALLPDGLADIMAMLDESIKKEEEELRNGERYPPAPDLVPATRAVLGRDDPGRNPHASPPVLSRQGSSASPHSRASSLEDDEDEEEEEEEYHTSIQRGVGNTDYRHSDLAKLYGLPERSKSEAEEEYEDDDSETPSCSPPPQRPHLHQTGVGEAFKSLAALLESQKYTYRGGPFGRPPPSALVGVKYSSSLSLGPDARRQTEPVGPTVPPEDEKATEDKPGGEKDEVTEDADGTEEERPAPESEGSVATTKERKEKERKEEKDKAGRCKKREKRDKEKRETAPGSSSGGSSRDRKRRKEGKSRKEKDRRILGDLNLQSKDRTDKSRRKKKREAALGLASEGKSDFPPKELKIRLIKVESGDGETFIASEVEEKRIPLEDIGIHNTASEIIRSCK